MERIKYKKVRDVMTRGVITVSLTASVSEIARILGEENISGLVVVAPDNEIMGVISEMDILKAFDGDWNELTAEDIMSSFVRTIEPEMTLGDAAKIMKDFNIHRLVVLHGAPGRSHDVPVGIICASDILRAVSGLK